VRTPEDWRDNVVADAIKRINAGELRKVVLARELEVTTDHPIDTAAVMERLRQSFSGAILFSIDGFIGASPELLVGRSGDVVRAHPLAGTAPRSSDPAIDQRLAAELHASPKNRHEHGITINWLLSNLLPYCSYVDAEPEPSIVTLANVHHLGTLVEGLLSSPPPSVLELVATLHPTPAVGGDPQGTATNMIAEIEGMDRGRYAGASGWVDGSGNGAFAVNVRVAQVSGTHATVYSGNGIVGDSDPEAELAETRAKFQAILGALVRP
jgi:isochorismate synthase